jgi:hypothetical protein
LYRLFVVGTKVISMYIGKGAIIKVITTGRKGVRGWGVVRILKNVDPP